MKKVNKNLKPVSFKLKTNVKAGPRVNNDGGKGRDPDSPITLHGNP